MAWKNNNGTWTTSRITDPITLKGRTYTFESQHEAVAWEEAAKKAKSEGKALPSKQNAERGNTVQDVIDRVLRDYYAYKTANTYETAVAVYSIIGKALGRDTHVADAMTTEAVAKMFAGFKARGIADSTFSSRYAFAKKMFELAVQWEYIDRAPVLPPRPTVRPNKFDYLTMDEVDKLLAALPARYRPILSFINATGMRYHEAADITREDIVGNTVTVIGKGNKRRVVPLSDTAMRAIESSDTTGDKVFAEFQKVSISNTFRRVAKSLFPSKTVTIHTLRHSFASRLAMKGLGLMQIQELLGHSNITMTRRYTHLAPDWMDSVQTMLD